MIDFWALFRNALWVTGLAIVLGVFGLASYEAQRAGIRLREQLQAPGFQLPFKLGLALFCLGLLFSGQLWWEYLIWGVLAVAFSGQAIWLWWRQRRVRRATVVAQGAVNEQGPARPGRARWMGWGLVLAGLILLGVWSAVTGAQLLQRARSLKSHLDHLEQLAQGGGDALGFTELESAGPHLAGMRHDLEAVQFMVAPLLPLGKLLGWVPVHGGDLAAARDLMEVATGVAVSGDRVFQALSPALGLMDDSHGSAPAGGLLGERLLPVLVAAQPELRVAAQRLDQVAELRDGIDGRTLSPQAAGLFARLDRYLPLFEMAVDGAMLAPSLLGAEGPRTYLILAQNNHELRPTGGFISGVGELGVEEGSITSLDFLDSYAVDNLEVPHEIPPSSLQRTLLGDLWLFRDSNWDADFPESARRALEIYAQDRGVRADGVIALDLTALETLLNALGPIQIEGIKETVSGTNIVEVLQVQWANPTTGADYEGTWSEDWWLHRKDFMGQVASASLDKLMAGRDVEPGNLARALMQVLDEKHLLLYLDDPQAGRLLQERGWDGALPDWFLTSDFLMVVDSNVGFNKVDPNVERAIEYQVDLGSNPLAHLTLTYRNRSQRPVEACVQEARYGEEYADMMDRCFWNYVRVYVPHGSKLVTGPDLALPQGSLWARNSEIEPRAPISPTLTEGVWTVWAAFFDLAPGEQRELTFEYELPVWVVDWDADGHARYRLNVQKQPGTLAVPLHTTIALPAGAEVVRTEPSRLFSQEADSLQAATDLRTDRAFVISFREEIPLP